VTDATSGIITLAGTGNIVSLGSVGAYSGTFTADGVNFIVKRGGADVDITFTNISVKEIL
jgi:hypothetical protein